jgi:3-oxoacyl-[acyl-carrier-protein] synthase-3
MRDAYLAAIAYHLPERIETNADLQRQHPDWDMARLGAKIGITERHIAAPGETAADLGVCAARKLMTEASLEPGAVDFLLFCTQSPDHFLPTSACIMQARLGLPERAGALDFNLGCSGYVYGLSVAKGLVSSGLADNVLLVTGETYSKFIHPDDRTVRALFGDAGTASLITAEPGGAQLLGFRFGTDGRGAKNLIVEAGALRTAPRTAAAKGPGAEHLFMDGREIFAFTLQRVPEVMADLLAQEGLTADEVGHYVLHQANRFMNDALLAKLGIAGDRAPAALERFGNTVSNTIPIVLAEHRHRFAPREHLALCGFGVGYSWAAGHLRWGRGW